MRFTGREEFIDKHGREPGPNDPVFFDPPHPEHLEHMMVEDMKAAGLDPAFIYAFEKTGRIVTEQNQHLLPTPTWPSGRTPSRSTSASTRKRSRSRRSTPLARWPSMAPTTR
jgi:hypothetical protein